jgi:ATP-dependent Clp protease protease subunit
LKFWSFKNIAATETDPESAELRIEGDIIDDNDVWLYEAYGVKATAPNAFKAALAEYDGKPLSVWIDNDGGNVFAADGIYTALMDRNGPVTTKIIKAFSAASEIAMAGGKVQISPVGKVLIHEPSMDGGGNAKDHRHIADFLDSVKESIMNAYQLKTGLSRNKISQMMSDETLMDARAAIKNGFADEELYADSKDPDAIMNFSFTKIRVLNSFKGQIEKLEALEQPRDGVNPGNISTDTAPENTQWGKPTLQDFTDKAWGDLSDGEKRDIAKHFAWAAEMPPNAFGDLKFPHHDPKSHKVVWTAVANAGARLGQSSLSDADQKIVQDHLGPHYKAFSKTPPWEQDTSTDIARAKLALQLKL